MSRLKIWNPIGKVADGGRFVTSKLQKTELDAKGFQLTHQRWFNTYSFAGSSLKTITQLVYIVIMIISVYSINHVLNARREFTLGSVLH